MEAAAHALLKEKMSDKIPSSEWQEIIAKASKSIKGRKLAEGLIIAIESCGQLQARHFPAGPNDRDEIQNLHELKTNT